MHQAHRGGIGRTWTGDQGWVRMLRVVQLAGLAGSLEWSGTSKTGAQALEARIFRGGSMRWSMSADGDMRAPGAGAR
jgi:hypothetical protein